MKTMLRYIAAYMTTVLVMGALLTGCQSAAPTIAATTAPAAAPTDAATTAPAEKTTDTPAPTEHLTYDPSAPVNDGKEITINFWDQQELDGFYKKWTAEYSKLHPNVKWNITSSAAQDLVKKLPLALQSGTGPDVFHLNNSWTAMIVNNMEAYPETVFPLAQLRADFIGVDNHLINGKLYYIDYGIMTGGIFYNKDMWAAAGLNDADIPKTWDKFIEVAKRLTQVDASGNMTVAGFDFNSMAQLLMNVVAIEHGQFFFSKDGKTAKLNTPEYVQACTFVRDLYTVHKVGDTKMPDAVTAFQSSKAAMIYAWGWVGSAFKTNAPDLKFGYFPVPTDDGNVPPAYDRNNGEATLGVNAGSTTEAKAVAMDFIKFLLCNDEAMLEHNLLIYVAPTKRSLLTRPEITGDLTLAGQTSILARTFWPGTVPSQYWNGISKYMADPIMLNGESPEEVLPDAEASINKDIAAADPNFTSVERTYTYAGEMKN